MASIMASITGTRTTAAWATRDMRLPRGMPARIHTAMTPAMRRIMARMIMPRTMRWG
jgi:hypothetical protein